MAVNPNVHVPPPRHNPAPHRKKIETYQQMVQEAEKQFIAALDKLNAEYLRILEVAGSGYAAAIDRAIRVYDALEQPARARYEQSLQIANDRYKGIVDPAQQELDRLSADARDMYERAIRPIEDAYNRALAEASAVTQGSLLGTGVP